MDTSQWDVDFQHGAGYIRFIHRDPSRLRLAFYTKEADRAVLWRGGYTEEHEAAFPGYKPRGRRLVRVVFVVRAYQPNPSRLDQPIFGVTMESSFATPPASNILGPVMVYDRKSPQGKPLAVRDCPPNVANLLLWELDHKEIVELLDSFKPGWGSACYVLLTMASGPLDVHAMEHYYRHDDESNTTASLGLDSLEAWPLSL
jgi:hypothetical protein